MNRASIGATSFAGSGIDCPGLAREPVGVNGEVAMNVCWQIPQ
jgi:hypothetical protein